LRWVDNATNEAKFVIERSTDSSFSSVVPFEVPSNTTSYRDRTVQASTTYFYRVFAVSATGLRSGPSNVATVSTK
jgi:fibronectin type 3 domain-containing protein